MGKQNNKKEDKYKKIVQVLLIIGTSLIITLMFINASCSTLISGCE